MKYVLVLFSLLGIQSAFSAAAFVDFDLRLIYPQQLGGMELQRVEKYENSALGYTAYYGKDTFSAEISVFNLERPSIDSGHTGPDITMVFDSVESMLKREEEGGLISNLRKRNAADIPSKGDFRFANLIFQYSEPRAEEGLMNSIPRINAVYVTAAHNNFIKVQFRFDVSNSKEAGSMAQELLGQLIKTFKAENSDQDLLLAACDALINHPADYSGRSAAQYVWGKAQTMGELNVYTHLFAWPDGYNKPKNADLLTMAYFAGMLKTIVPQGLESGGEVEGFAAMLLAYEGMRSRDEIEAISQLDEWVKVADKKALFEELLYVTVEE